MRASSDAAASERRSNYSGAVEPVYEYGLHALEAQQVAQACLPVLGAFVAATSGSHSQNLLLTNGSQHSITFNANPPSDVSLYRDCISIPV
jgi:hypothetical protein